MWLVGSKPIWSYFTMVTSFLAIRVNEYLLYKWCHLLCVMTSSVIPSLSILNIWRCWGWQPRNQVPVVQTLANAIHWINHYPADSIIDLFTDTTTILNKLDLRSIMGSPVGMSTIQYTRWVLTRAFRANFSVSFQEKDCSGKKRSLCRVWM